MFPATPCLRVCMCTCFCARFFHHGSTKLEWLIEYCHVVSPPFRHASVFIKICKHFKVHKKLRAFCTCRFSILQWWVTERFLRKFCRGSWINSSMKILFCSSYLSSSFVTLLGYLDKNRKPAFGRRISLAFPIVCFWTLLQTAFVRHVVPTLCWCIPLYVDLCVHVCLSVCLSVCLCSIFTSRTVWARFKREDCSHLKMLKFCMNFAVVRVFILHQLAQEQMERGSISVVLQFKPSHLSLTNNEIMTIRDCNFKRWQFS